MDKSNFLKGWFVDLLHKLLIMDLFSLIRNWPTSVKHNSKNGLKVFFKQLFNITKCDVSQRMQDSLVPYHPRATFPRNYVVVHSP